MVKVTGLLTGDQEQEFRDGVPLMGRRTLPAGLRLIRNAANPWYEVKLIEGRNNQIRLMFKHLGQAGGKTEARAHRAARTGTAEARGIPLSGRRGS